MTLPSSERHRSHWFEHAATWDHFGPPLRPHPFDMGHVQAQVQALLSVRANEAPRALLLGVTPEYALLPWPAGTAFTAVDKSLDMIQKVWPASRLSAGFKAVQGLWTDLPLGDGAVDLAMGDGISTVLPHWSFMDSILAELHRVCAPGATLILRLFVNPDVPDTLEQLMVDLETGRLQGFHAFKLRLLMLLQRSLDQGVQPREAWKMWHALRGQHAACIESRRWSTATVNTIEAYAQSNDTYWFPTQAQALSALGKYFEPRNVHHSDVELGDRCPIFVLERRD